MDDWSTTDSSARDSSERPENVRRFLYAFALSHLLFLTDLERDIVSIEVTVAAVGIGLLVGTAMAYTLADVHVGRDSPLVTSIATLVGIGVATVLLWVLLPREHISTVSTFTTAFILGAALTSAIRHHTRPATGATSAE
ncbi:hypothetical protein [Natrinema caseinilyticum]|uniref:hypothetical protein n=1 Tax=Natrinema caseinilyticum TaxID=2961570 RepID=UPI0020C37F96|nr:hypothetical protein [Natrinema caseinilyticum]